MDRPGIYCDYLNSGAVGSIFRRRDGGGEYKAAAVTEPYWQLVYYTMPW